MTDGRNRGRGESVILISGFIGGGLSIAVMLVINGVLAWLISLERIQQAAMGYGTLIALLLSSAVGAVAAIRHAKSKQLIVSALSGLIYFVGLLVITIFFFGGEFDGLAVTAAVIMAGCLGVALLRAGVGNKGQKRTGKRRHR